MIPTEHALIGEWLAKSLGLNEDEGLDLATDLIKYLRDNGYTIGEKQ